LSNGAGASYLSVHQDAQLRKALQEIASRTPWTAVADRKVDRDLAIGALRISTDHEGERDVAAFSRSTVAFRRPLGDVVRNYNAYISEQALDELLQQLSDLLDAGLLCLRPDHSGKTNHNRIKGLLGTLIAARWYRQTGANDRLLVSLDSADARRWMHLSDDALQADLVGFEWSDDCCTVSVMEVKAVQTSSTEFVLSREGLIEGPAVEQMLSTRRLLQTVFAADRGQELITTPARREILREHLYRELTKGSYSAQQRERWADRLQRLLDGNVKVELRCHLVSVRLGVDSATLGTHAVAARDGELTIPTQITELNEREIPALVPPGDRPAPESGSVPRHEDLEGPLPRNEPVTPVATRESAAGSIAEGTAAESPTASADSIQRPRALIGTAPGSYGKKREVWFDPSSPEEKLPNPHIAITGETGSGKTQATKAVIAELQGSGIPALILDFKDDYSDSTYAETEGLAVYDPTYQPLPFNPLSPPVDPRTGQVNANYHTHQITEIVKRVYGLGDQQAYRLREAMKTVYEHAGIPTSSFAPEKRQAFPPFEAIRDQLSLDKENNALLGRMSPVFDLGLFVSGEAEVGFSTVIASSTVVRLGQLPGNETKNSVAEFFLLALYNYLIRQPQIHALKRILVLDEAWRLVESPFLEPLMREGRAFGLGVFVATQFPADLPPAISGSTATKLFFSQTYLTQIREIQRIVIGKSSGAEADHLAGMLRGLSPLTCVLHSKHYPPYVRVTIKPYFERRPSPET